VEPIGTVLPRDVRLLVSDAIVSETLRVLRDKFKLSSDRLETAEAYIARWTERVVRTETLDAVPSDPDDDRVLECDSVAGATVIVSGDDDRLRRRSFSLRIEADFTGTGCQLVTFTG
jgi:predicted nucleic acid-binding protein